MNTRCLVLMVLVVSSIAGEATARKWTDSTGKHTVEAEFVDCRDGKVQLRKEGGAVISVPLEKLSHLDQQHVEQLMAKDVEAGHRGMKDETAHNRGESANEQSGEESAAGSARGPRIHNLKILTTKKSPVSLSFELDVQPPDTKIAEVWIVIGVPQFAKKIMAIVAETPPPSGIDGGEVRDVGAFHMVKLKVDREKSTNERTVLGCEVTINSVSIIKEKATVSVFLRDSNNEMSNLLTLEASFK